jgi:hypothetical protein
MWMITKLIKNIINTSKTRVYCKDGGHKDVFGRRYKLIYKTKKPLKAIAIGVKNK